MVITEVEIHMMGGKLPENGPQHIEFYAQSKKIKLGARTIEELRSELDDLYKRLLGAAALKENRAD